MLNTGGFIGEGWRIYPGWKVARINCIIYIRRIRVLFVILFENIFQLGSILFLFIPPTFIPGYLIYYFRNFYYLHALQYFNDSLRFFYSPWILFNMYLVSPFGFLTNYLIIPFIIFILLLINFYLFIYLFIFFNITFVLLILFTSNFIHERNKPAPNSLYLFISISFVIILN